MSDAITVAREYLDAWNAHDAARIVATFADGGTYEDPASGQISGAAIGENAQRLWAIFPDLSFEVISIGQASPGTVAMQWRMKGTNTEPYQGMPPTGRTVSLPGADFIDVAGDKIRSVKGYFDGCEIPRQLGLQVLVQPFQLGPFSFGNSTAVHSGNPAKPGAFSITAIWNEDSETEEIRNLGRDIGKEILGVPGFIGLLTIRVAGWGVTVAAWERPEDTRQFMRTGSHSQAMRRFWESLSNAGYTSVWAPHRINPFWVRCGTCKKMNDYEKSTGVCACGAALPERPPYF